MRPGLEIKVYSENLKFIVLRFLLIIHLHNSYLNHLIKQHQKSVYNLPDFLHHNSKNQFLLYFHN